MGRGWCQPAPGVRDTKPVGPELGGEPVSTAPSGEPLSGRQGRWPVPCLGFPRPPCSLGSRLGFQPGSSLCPCPWLLPLDLGEEKGAPPKQQQQGGQQATHLRPPTQPFSARPPAGSGRCSRPAKGLILPVNCLGESFNELLGWARAQAKGFPSLLCSEMWRTDLRRPGGAGRGAGPGESGEGWGSGREELSESPLRSFLEIGG